jgi:hypothetical protein
MPSLQEMRTVIINVHLGGAPLFEILADDTATATPADCKWSARGAGPDAQIFLAEVLEMVARAYASSQGASLCVDGPRIRRRSDCHA